MYKRQIIDYTPEYSLFIFCLTFTFQLLDKLWSQVSSLLPPGTCIQFLSRIGFSIPTARRLSSNVANSRFRSFRESIWCTRKSPLTHEIDLWQALYLFFATPPGRPALYLFLATPFMTDGGSSTIATDAATCPISSISCFVSQGFSSNTFR